MAKRKATGKAAPPAPSNYDGLLSRISLLLEQGRRSAIRTVNAILAATYWEVGRQIVEHEQGGKAQAEYGEEIVDRLARDLTARYGRGFSRRNVFQMKAFFLQWEIAPTASGKWQARSKYLAVSGEAGIEKVQTASAQLQPLVATPLPPDPAAALVDAFPLPWSHYVHLMSVPDDFARSFYEDEAIRAGWSVRQLDRQIATQFFERTALSRNKEAMILKGRRPRPEDAVTLEETIRDPYLLEVRHDNREGIADPVSRTLERRCLSRPTYLKSKDNREHSLLVKRRLTTKCPDHAPRGLRSTVKATPLELQFRPDLR